jgi:hypothetical protein
VPVGLFVLLMIYSGLTMSPQKSALYDKQRRIEQECDKMMSDAALGSQRQMTRAICDRMKGEVEAEIRSSR